MKKLNAYNIEGTTELEEKSSLFLKELWLGLFICATVLVIQFFYNSADKFTIGLLVLESLSFSYAIYLIKRQYNLSVFIYLFACLFAIVFAAIFQPGLKNEALLCSVIALNGLFYIKNDKHATQMLFLCIILGVGMIGVEFLDDYRGTNELSNNFYNSHIILFIFYFILFGKIIFVSRHYNGIKHSFFKNKEELVERGVKYRSIFDNSAVAIVTADVSKLQKAINVLKNNPDITNILDYLRANPAVIKQLYKTIHYKNINRKGLEIIGVEDISVFSKKSFDYYNETVERAFLKEIEALYNGKSSFETEMDYINYKNEYKRLKYFVNYGQSDDLKNAAYSYIDITDLQKAKIELKATNERYKTLYANAPVGIIILDIDELKRGLDCNQMLLNILKVEKEVALNGNMIVLSPEKQPDGQLTSIKLGKILGTFRKNRKPISFEWEFKTGENQLIRTEVTLSAIEWEGKEESIMFIKDITKQKKQQEVILQQLVALNNKNEELERYIESNLELENFAYIASHDLQAPLRTVVSFSELLKKSFKNNLSEAQEEYMKFIMEGSYHMRQLINDLLAFSSINTSLPNPESIKIQHLVELILLDLKENIEEKNASIYCSNLDFTITADKTKIRQLFQNLIANAMKFVDKDVEPNIVIEGEELDTHWKFSIKDNGIGIAPEFQEQVFLMFKRLHGQQIYKGTGIGLSLCKKIVEQHNGEIKVISEEGKGATFYFTIDKTL